MVYILSMKWRSHSILMNGVEVPQIYIEVIKIKEYEALDL